ncbi:hypothetical protein [Microcoleus sp. B5-D4]|uniref:hypothetical protein n=1 Tax=Microcoleus sp. B5-D4 TaxID=2818681 RepID=UPI002FD3A728
MLREKAKALTIEMLHHSQERALRPVPQEMNFIVEQAGKPVHKMLIENGATSQLLRTFLVDVF